MTISSPNGQTPTDLMLTPNWLDQKAGKGKVWPALGFQAQHVGRSDLGAEDRVVPMLQHQKLVVV